MHLPGRTPGRVAAVAVLAVALPLLTAACGKDDPGPAAAVAEKRSAAEGRTLVVDTSFIVKSLDPQRNLQPTALMANKATYDTLLTSTGSGATPRPSAAASFTASADAKRYTFRLRDDIVFSDGSPLRAADVVFSFRRLLALADAPSYLLAGVTATAPDDHTVVLESATPNPAIPTIVTSPALGIVNSTVVKAHGGDDGAHAADRDKAERYLNANSAGSGPYVLKSYASGERIALTANPKYWNARARPAFADVVIRNMQAPAQLLNVQRGTDEVALDLSAQQAAGLRSNEKLQVSTGASPNLFTLQANQDPKVSPVTSNLQIQAAIRRGVDYAGLVATAGAGTVQAAGVIPIPFLGALPTDQAVTRDVAEARRLVAASGIEDPKIRLSFPSDISINGLQFATLAQRVAADLQEIGIDVALAAEPVVTFLPKYKAGKDAMVLSYWGPDYTDPQDYLVFTPGGTVAKFMSWKAGADPGLEALAARAGATSDDVVRKDLFTRIQRRLNERSPWIPLIQPAQAIVGSSGLTGLALHSTWTLDLAAVAVR